MSAFRRAAFALAAFFLIAAPAQAQSPTVAPPPSPAPAASPVASPTVAPAASPAAAVKKPASPWSWSFLMRLMPEYYDFYKNGASNENAYVYGGIRMRGDLAYKKADLEARLQLQNVLLLGLPKGSVVPAPGGSLGQGAVYFNLDRRSSLDTFGIRQLFARIGAPTRSSVQVGRFEYTSGMESLAEDPIVQQVKFERTTRKMIATLNYNAWTRTFDGLRGDLDLGPVRVTALAMHPTQVEPHFATDVRSVFVGNLAVTLQNSKLMFRNAEVQLYWNRADDSREVAQVDNRPKKGTIAAEGGNRIDTYGFHYVQKLGRDGDVTAWYGHQSGKWGLQTQDANAFEVDAGWRFPQVSWKPMVRLGWSIYSGDTNPLDNKHGTFVAQVPDNRGYTPWWTTVNLNHVLAGVYAYPDRDTRLIFELHRFNLDSGDDLWYAGVGTAQQKGVNGYAGRASGGMKSLGTQIDIAAEYKIDDNNRVSARYERYWGGSVVRNDFPLKSTGQNLIVDYHLSLP